jgi:maltoporin
MYGVKIGEGGKNQLGLQYGQGAAFNFNAQMTAPKALDGVTIARLDTDELATFRVLDNLIWDLNNRWTFQGLALYQKVDLGTDTDDTVQWLSFGARPVYHFNRFFSLAAELGYDYTDKDGAESGSLYKVTLAPQITPEAKTFSRPSLRAFLTYAWWSDEFEGLVGSPSYSDDTEGLSAGVQVEAWF